MDLNRPLITAAAALAATSLASGGALIAGRARRKRHASLHRYITGGCSPDVGYFINTHLIVHDVGGSHLGVATSLLRDRFLSAEESAAADLPEAEAEVLQRLFEGEESDPALTLDFETTLRSCIEVTLDLAIEMALEEVDEDCECGDEDCEAVNGPLLAVIAGRHMVETAMTFERFARSHAAECRRCKREGTEAPAYLRARFARDIADDLLTNFEDDETHLRGVPIPAAVDVIASLVEVIHHAQGVTPEAQIARLSRGVAGAIAHKEGHPLREG